MIEPIGESTVRMTVRTDQQQAAENRDAALRQAEKVVEARPVESSQETATTESDVEQKKGGYNSDDDGIFFEKYDKKGNVVYRVPPEQNPIDEHV